MGRIWPVDGKCLASSDDRLNPHPPHSFLKLRKGLGPAWVVCEPCRRYVLRPPGIDQRDTRVTAFSCSVCGGVGRLVDEDPEKQGFQPDLRKRPLRHPMAMMRIKMLRQLDDSGPQEGCPRIAAPAPQAAL
jgi:hypothetical protein